MMPVKIGFMSFAHMHAASYATCLKGMPEAVIAGIADDDSTRGAEMAKTFDTQLFPSYEALLAADIDAVVIASENIRHRELTEMAAKAGKHVLCEKPIATTIEDGRAMIEVCREHNVKLMTAFPCRFSPSIVRVKEKVDAGCIGEVLAIKGTNHGKMPGGWFIDLAKSGGGAVIDHTVHVADLMRWVLRSEPAEVYAEISNAMHHGDYDDCGLLTITFENGVFSTLDTSWTRPKAFPVWGDVTMEIQGTKGVIVFDMFNQNLHVYSNENTSCQTVNWGSNTDLLMVKDFVTSVANDLPVSVTGEDGLAALSVALAAYQSQKAGAPVRVR